MVTSGVRSDLRGQVVMSRDQVMTSWPCAGLKPPTIRASAAPLFSPALAFIEAQRVEASEQ